MKAAALPIKLQEYVESSVCLLILHSAKKGSDEITLLAVERSVEKTVLLDERKQDSIP